MRYTFIRGDAIDLDFSVRPRKAHWALGYLAMMWASYMNHTRERCIHFIGDNQGVQGWVRFGEDTAQAFETGTVACAGSAPLRYESGAQTLNITEHPSKKFLKPFFYGLVDGDGDATTDDTMVYIMIFNQAESIRFALWNFITDSSGQPDPRSPAWDWQFVIRNPEIDRRYGYKARVIYKPFAGEADVRREYEAWKAGVPE